MRFRLPSRQSRLPWFRVFHMRLSFGPQAGEDLFFKVARWIDGRGRRIQGAVHLPKSFELVSAAGAGRNVAPDFLGFFGVQRPEDEGRQVRVAFWTIHRVATHQASASASSSRRLLKARAVLVFTVPRGTPVRREISR
jgi:hypothetical protein